MRSTTQRGGGTSGRGTSTWRRQALVLIVALTTMGMIVAGSLFMRSNHIDDTQPVTTTTTSDSDTIVRQTVSVGSGTRRNQVEHSTIVNSGGDSDKSMERLGHMSDASYWQLLRSKDRPSFEDSSPSLPYVYPMHSTLPRNRHGIVSRSLNNFFNGETLESSSSGGGSCISHQGRFPAALYSSGATISSPDSQSALEKEFDFTFSKESKHDAPPLFYEESSDNNVKQFNGGGEVLHPVPWVPSDSVDTDTDAENLPCTSFIQRRFWELNHNTKETCAKQRFLVSTLKEGAHGVGSAITLISHDLLSSVVLGRGLLIVPEGGTRSKWFFSGDACAAAGRSSWSCYFTEPSHCHDAFISRSSGKHFSLSSVPKVGSKKEALQMQQQQFIRKKTFDAKGMGRNDVLTDEEFFGMEFMKNPPTCYAKYQQWVADDANINIQGTFSKGADRRLFYMLSQATKYLMRYQQPWFAEMLAQKLSQVGVLKHPVRITTGAGVGDTSIKNAAVLAPSSSSSLPSASSSIAPMIYVQERGEIAKFREYFNTFGCHNIATNIHVDLVQQRCINSSGGGEDSSSRHTCTVFVSGNTPKENYHYIMDSLAPNSSSPSFIKGNGPIVIKSTWALLEIASKGTERWGASGLSASWVDMYAALTASSWICIVQSNWCRVINFLRLTTGRAACPFVDAGALMIASTSLRQRYCLIKSEWPTKAFSNVLKKNTNFTFPDGTTTPKDLKALL